MFIGGDSYLMDFFWSDVLCKHIGIFTGLSCLVSSCPIHARGESCVDLNSGSWENTQCVRSMPIQ
jgi:hypothetical protein